LIAIYAALSGETKAEVLARFAGQGFGVFKPALVDLAVETLAPVTAAMRRLMADPAEIDRVLVAGAEKAAVIAEATVKEVKARMGLWPGAVG
jgi:tryptophanyl-tRNA synthetase